MDTKEERREHHRFDSLGDIIAINSKNYGQVVNLSMTGLRVKYFMRPSDSFKNSFTISLLNKNGNKYIDNLPCKVVSLEDSTSSSSPVSLFTREAGIVFGDLTSSQMKQLSDFVVHTVFSVGEPKL